MPVEIKELIIRAVAEADQEDEQGASPVCSGTDTEAVVELCVKQVLRILKKSKDR